MDKAGSSKSSTPEVTDLTFMNIDHMSQHVAPQVEYLELSPSRKIAYRFVRGRGPTLIYVPGYSGTMEIHKAKAVEQYAKNNGLSCIRYDPCGRGLSSGKNENTKRFVGNVHDFRRSKEASNRKVDRGHC